MKVTVGYIEKGDTRRHFTIMRVENTYKYLINIDPREGRASQPHIPRTLRGVQATMERWEAFGYTLHIDRDEIGVA